MMNIKMTVQCFFLFHYNGATDKPCGEGVRTLTQNCC